MTAVQHVTYLAREIGPRGSTRPGEAKAAEYAAEVLTRCGLEPETASFVSARSAWYPSALFSGLMLIAAGCFLVGGRIGGIAATALGAVSVASILLELAFRPNPLRWVLPRGTSRNVSARIPARGEARRKVVLVGHLDTHRTPIVFSSDRWVKLFRILIPLGLVASLVMVAMFAAGLVIELGQWRWLALAPGLLLVAILAISLQADLTPFTEGANDNASGAGTVLGLAEDLAKDPLRETDVWVVLTGCEEVGCYGAEAFVRGRKDELAGASWLTLDNIGGQETDLRYVTTETFLLTTRSDAELLKIAGSIAAERPELKARPLRFRGAYTEGAIGAKYGMRVLTLIATQADGTVPDWHRPTDNLERVGDDALTRCESFVKELLARIDAGHTDAA